MSRANDSYLRSYYYYDIDKYDDDWTIMGWFLASTLTTGYATVLVYFSGTNETRVYVELKSISSVWNLEIVSVAATADYPVGITANKWYHVAVAYAASTHTLYIYLNGVLLGTVAQSNRDYGEEVLSLGYYTYYSLNGLLDEFVLYNKTLTAQDIRRYYAWATGRL